MAGQIIAGFGFVLGTAFLLTALFGLYRRNRIRNGWVPLDNGVVLDSKVVRSRSGSFPVVSYEYHSGDMYYVGEANLWAYELNLTQTAAQTAARYKKGDVVRVYVDPDNHQVSVLQPTPPLSLCLISIALSAACFAIGYWVSIAPATYAF